VEKNGGKRKKRFLLGVETTRNSFINMSSIGNVICLGV
jgi:hypothetical protein